MTTPLRRSAPERPGSRRTPLIVTQFDPLTGAVEYGGRITSPTGRDVSDMLDPVKCHGCGAIYDTGEVTVTARYADCSTWNAPCCGRPADSRLDWSSDPDRHMGYTSLPGAGRFGRARQKPSTQSTTRT